MRWVFKSGGSSKFWEAAVRGKVLTVAWGKTGTKGQTKAKSFATEAKASAELAKLEREKRAKGYVADRAKSAAGEATPKPTNGKRAKPKASNGARANAKPTNGERAKAKPTSGMRANGKPPKGGLAHGGGDPYPFLFYGASPNDWAGPSFEWFVRFREVPDKKTVARIHTVVREALDDTPAESFGFSSFKKGWALAGAEEPIDDDIICNRDFFPLVQDAFVRVHAVAPIAEVVFLNCKLGGTSAWDAWTRKTQPTFSAGESFGGLGAIAFDRASTAFPLRPLATATVAPPPAKQQQAAKTTKKVPIEMHPSTRRKATRS